MGAEFQQEGLQKWMEATNVPSSDEWDRPAGEHDIDEGEPRLFGGLEASLEKGQKGKFGGESASFDFAPYCHSAAHPT